MATVTVLLKKDYQSKDNTYPIIIRLKNGKEVKVVNTKYKILESQFKNGQVIRHDDADLINGVINDKVHRAKKYFADCTIQNRPINLSLVFEERATVNFCDYILKRAEDYKAKGKIIMWQKLTRFEKEINLCFGRKLYLDELDIDKLRTLENFLINLPNHPNTIAKKFKFLKHLYQSAIDEGLHTGINHFKKYKIQTYPVKKEKLTTQQIKAIEGLELSGQINDARNLFLFSYYAKGVRFENCIFLKRSQIRDGRIYFTSNKGRKNISVAITSNLKKILDQYTGKEFVFAWIKELPDNPISYRQVKDSINSMVNRWLKIVAGLAKIDHLVFHQARHSISYHLKQSGVNINAIKDVLGHSDTKTTEIYLKSLDDEYLDEEMKKVYGE